MFVRFEHRTNVGAHARTRSRRLKRPWSSLVVGIAESRRVDGRPRQQFLAYLGTIHRDDIHLPDARRRFWDRVDDRLAVFPLEVRERLEPAIAAKIPRPPAEDGLSLAQKLAAAGQRMLAARTARAALRSSGTQAVAQ